MKKRFLSKAVSILLALVILIAPMSFNITTNAAGVVVEVDTEQELYDALKGTTGTSETTIQLVGDITVGNVFGVMASKRVIVKSGQNIIFDLGNYTLSCDWYYNAYMMEIREGATVKIISDANGKITKTTGGRCIRNEGNLTVDGNIMVPVVSGGTTENRLIYNEGGTLVINNGLFYGNFDSDTNEYDWGSWIVNDGIGTINIYNGKFIAKVSPANNIFISGGQFYAPVNPEETWSHMLVPGYTYNTNTYRYYTVQELDYSIIDTVDNKYNDMLVAINSTSDTETLTLINSLLTVTTDQEWIFGGRTLVDDGYTISCEPGVVVTSDIPLDCIESNDGLYDMEMVYDDTTGKYIYTSTRLPYIARIGNQYYGNVEILKQDAKVPIEAMKQYIITGVKTSDMPIVTLLDDCTIRLTDLQNMIIDPNGFLLDISMDAVNTHYNFVTYADGYNTLYWCHLIGDMNGDDTVDILDLVRQKKLSCGMDRDGILGDNTIYNLFMDLDEDGFVNSFDIILMRKYLLEAIDTFK